MCSPRIACGRSNTGFDPGRTQWTIDNSVEAGDVPKDKKPAVEQVANLALAKEAVDAAGGPTTIGECQSFRIAAARMAYLRLMVRSALDPSRRSPTWVRVSNHVASEVSSERLIHCGGPHEREHPAAPHRTAAVGGGAQQARPGAAIRQHARDAVLPRRRLRAVLQAGIRPPLRRAARQDA